MQWCSIPHSFLAMTKPSEYSDESRLEVRPSISKYLFVYPFVKTRDWYLLPMSERQRIMNEHIAIGHKYPRVKINTTYSFGLDDQDFVVAFETDSRRRVPRPRAGPAHHRVVGVHPARHADLHLRLDLGRARSVGA